MCPNEVKCNKIFRPWDNNFDQDSTVSTTTNPEIKEVGVNIKDEETECEEKGFRPVATVKKNNFESIPPYTEIVPVVNDQWIEPFQGFSLEEYARVLNQEHHAKVLNSKKQRPKKYKCPHCDVGFSNNGQLKGHIRIHTGERPFKCDEKDCGKTFTRNEELTRHKRIHSGLRPFPCTHCGKRFGRKDHLKKHSRTHFQPRGMYAVPVMLPFEAWASAYPPYLPMYGF